MIVVDNSILSALHRLDQLSILLNLFDEIIVPDAVYSEFKQKWGHIKFPDEFTFHHTINNFSKKLTDFTEFKNLGDGEKEVIQVAFEHNCLAGIDDLLARKVSLKVNEKIVGTIGISKLAYQLDHFSSRDVYHTFIDNLSKDLYISTELTEWAKNV